MCKSEYKLIRKMQWDGDVLKVQDTMHDVLREAKQSMTDAMTGEVLNHFECDFSDFREYMHDKIKWERKQELAIPHWISVTERLPEEPGEYIVAYHPCHWDIVNPSVKVGIDNFRGKTTWSKNKHQRVIAWQEKPEPPKEDGDGADMAL